MIKPWHILTSGLLLVMLLLLTSIFPPPQIYATKAEHDGLKLEKFSSDAEVSPGDTVHYYIKLTNTTDSPISVDRLMDGRDPSNTTQFGNVIPEPPGHASSHDVVIWEDFVVDPGETKIFHVNVVTCQYTNVCGSSTENWATAIVGDTFIDVEHKVDFCEPFWDTVGINIWGFDVWCPIQASTGENYFPPAIDINLGGPLPVTLSRYYASGLKDDGLVQSTLGTNWVHNFDHYIANPFSFFPVLVDQTGNAIEFAPVTLNPNNLFFVPNDHEESIPYELKNDSGGDFDYWFLDPASQLIYRFDINGRLEQILDRNENKLTITRDGSNRVGQVADGLGRALDFTYDGDGSLTLVSDGSRTFTYEYDANNNLDRVTNPMTNVTDYQYDPLLTHGPLMTGKENPEGNTHYGNTYNTAGQVIQQQDAYGNTAILAYGSPTAVQTTVNDPSGIHVYTHDNNLGTDMQDQAGKTFTRNFDDRERPVSIDDRMGGTTRISWHDLSGQIASITNAGSETLNYTYTPQDQLFINPTTNGTVSFTFYDLTRIDYPDGTNRQFTYDQFGNMTIGRDQSGNDTYYSYDEMGNVLIFANPAGGSGTNTYNPNGTLNTSENSDTGVTNYEYDSLNRLNKIVHPDTSFVQMTYNLSDQLTIITDELGHVYEYVYDSNGNLINAIDPTLENTQYAYDLMDRIDRTTNRFDYVTTHTYDTMGRLGAVTSPGSINATYGYDKRGWPDGVTVDGKTWQTIYNDEGIPISDTTPEGRTATYQSNELGYLTEVIRPGSLTTTLTRDNMSRVTQVNDPLNRITNYTYGNRGLLDGITLPVIGSTAYQYDSMGSLIRITDLNGNNWDFGYTGMGLLKSGTDPLGNNRQYTYDNRGRPDVTSLPSGDTVTHTYDGASNMTQAQYSGGPILDYTYDDLNRLDTTNDLDLDYDLEGRIVGSEYRGNNFGATYNADGQLQTATYNNGNMIVTYTYDSNNGRLTGVADDLIGATVGFSYDDDGLLTGMTRSNGVDGTYTYDGAGRLVRIQEGGDIDLQYTLDDAGQATDVDMVVPLAPWDCLVTSNDTLTYDAASQVSSSGYSYDPLGRRLTSPSDTFTWNGASQLTSIGIVGLNYNGLGEIISRMMIGATTHYYHNHALSLNPIVAEERAIPGPASSQFTRYYVWTSGGRLLYMIDLEDSNKVYFYHFDRTGSTLALTDGDTGLVTDSYAYTPYGTLLQHDGSNGQPFTFVGASGIRQEDGSGELYQMRARYYDANTASFLSRDPVWPNINNPKALNPYSYANQEPINTVDVTGLDPDSSWEDDWEIFTSTPLTPENDIFGLLNPSLSGGYGLPFTHTGNNQSVIKWLTNPGFNNTPGGWTLGWDTGFDVNPGSLPIPGDYNGDGIDDTGSYQPWPTSPGPSWDPSAPIPGDFNGDGLDDLGSYDPNTGRFYPAPATNKWGDYNGVAVDPSYANFWYVQNSHGNQLQSSWGANTPITGDWKWGWDG